jgi:hypothetical protein
MRALMLLLALSACNEREMLQLRYQLTGLDVTQVVRIETIAAVDPGDSRRPEADQPFQSAGQGVGWEVKDIDGRGNRVMLITHDATLGFQMRPSFVFTLLPPSDGTPLALQVSARAVGDTRNMLSETRPVKAAFGRGATLDVKLTDQRCGGQVCAADELCCDDQCRPISTDPFHCGSCEKSCNQGEVCIGAACRCGSATACDAGKSCCAGGCFDLTADKFNCGACGNKCNTGEMCVGGACTCNGAAACSAGGLCCSDGCQPIGGACACGAGLCGAPNVCCNDSACVDITSSNAHCGDCNRACAAPLTCTGGSCRCNGQVCGSDDTCCVATGGSCANLKDDVRNCGMCGKSCAAGERCEKGACVCGSTACQSGQLCCGGTCVDPSQDNLNCGGCNLRCATGESCDNSKCSCQGGPPCVGNQTCCPGDLIAGGCFDLSADPQNCGECGEPCGASQACEGGNCVATSCNPACPPGHACVGGSCQCQGGPPCTNGETCCATGCKDLLNDQMNCGACMAPCYGLCCNGMCINQDNNNCGMCGFVCGATAGPGNLNCCVCSPNEPGFCSFECLCTH